MGVFREEIMEFEGMVKSLQKYYGATGSGWKTNNEAHTGMIDSLRDWMKDMADVKIGRQINGNVRLDEYFVAFEEEDGIARGVKMTVRTVKTNYNAKEITLAMNNAFFRTSELKRMYK